LGFLRVISWIGCYVSKDTIHELTRNHTNKTGGNPSFDTVS